MYRKIVFWPAKAKRYYFVEKYYKCWLNQNPPNKTNLEFLSKNTARVKLMSWPISAVFNGSERLNGVCSCVMIYGSERLNVINPYLSPIFRYSVGVSASGSSWSRWGVFVCAGATKWPWQTMWLYRLSVLTNVQQRFCSSLVPP